MAAPISKQLTFCKLSTFNNLFGGVGGVRFAATLFFHRKDRTAEQRRKQEFARMKEAPGPWKSYAQFQKGKRTPRPQVSFDPTVTELLQAMNISKETKNDMVII